MSIEALVLGKLHQRAEERTSKAGRSFIVAKVRAAAGDADSLFVNVIAFSESACAALLALDAGDSVALAGTLKPGAWTDREGNARPSVDLVAAQVMTQYGLKKKRDAAQASERQPESARRQQPAGDDFGADDDAWLNGGRA
ncbi:MAG: single-stranded DNA-binding protein [Burkholderiales bacterium]|nr:single-stranded DNA-binding protein [Burkholderiales bacterium]MDE1926285.1 single-stranded DNA-binding protein [Burkholderiales bacterium]MDE2502620.1 single-stranded DNA-binding protein [Burkholderiales bacterium]